MPQIETQYPYLAIGLAVVSIIWFLAARNQTERRWHLVGSFGTAIAACVLFAILNAASAPWIWVFPQLIFSIWLASFGLIAAATAFVIAGSSKLRVIFAGMGVLGALLSGWAGLVFLWFATVSTGGV